MDENLSKYVKSESVEVNRSELSLADYNPRILSEEARKSLKRGIKKFGLVGGIVVNKRTGMTIVSGHQRISVMDELNKYPDNDYRLRVDVIDVDDKQEKELNILMNNPNAQGVWDYEGLRRILPEIDYKDAGLTEADLSMIGVDYLYKTEEENDIADELRDLMTPITELNEQEKKRREAEREAERQAEREAKIQHIKNVKAEVKNGASDKAGNLDAYVVLSFDTWQAKNEFLDRFGYPLDSRYIKGEEFDERCEAVIDFEE